MLVARSAYISQWLPYTQIMGIRQPWYFLSNTKSSHFTSKRTTVRKINNFLYFLSTTFFASVFTAENFLNFPSFDQVIKDKNLSLLHCSPKDVSKILSELKPRKSPGPDCIHPMILKKCAETLAPSLSDVFNVSLASGM